MFGQKPIMPTEDVVVTWAALPWTEEMELKDLLALRMRQLERRQEDVKRAVELQKAARWKSKEYFDKSHRLRPQKIEEGDWVLVYDSSLDHQHSSLRKFARRWFGPYIVWKVFENGTYRLQELDGIVILNLFACKRVKIFMKRQEKHPTPDYILSTQDEVPEETPEDFM
jgi:hypothetical protein